jgi:hypothetical protein
MIARPGRVTNNNRNRYDVALEHVMNFEREFSKLPEGQTSAKN